MAIPALSICQQVKTTSDTSDMLEKHRPAFHFSPGKGWMNDPNGLIFHKGFYHLFFQYTPTATTPNFEKMHWGHAVSSDLVNWKELPASIFPDDKGAIFSGSTVADINNTSGFGQHGEIPLVAVYTQHDPKGERAGHNDFQKQALAYSLDDGQSWIKFEGNPVLSGSGIRDFRDPKVIWHEESGQWIMTLATNQSITFYGSNNLKHWERLSEFGAGVGEHGGVWECPDLLRFQTKSGEKWVLLVSLNPGGPNKGSGTQYFVGSFDGKQFTTDQKDTRWMDYGPDNYAGVTFANTGARKLLIGWMSNWEYADRVPSSTWRGGNTIVRELRLVSVGERWLLVSSPVEELKKLCTEKIAIKKTTIGNGVELSRSIEDLNNTFQGSFEIQKNTAFEIELANSLGEKLVFGLDKNNQYFIDRSEAGDTNFSDKFIKYAMAPRIETARKMAIRFLIDQNSIEFFGDHGKTNMSGLFFINSPFTTMKIKSNKLLELKNLSISLIEKSK